MAGEAVLCLGACDGIACASERVKPLLKPLLIGFNWMTVSGLEPLKPLL
jgi:hypothetical protein